jgi:hypothetical protein
MSYILGFTILRENNSWERVLEGDNIKEDLEWGSKIWTDFKWLTLISSGQIVRKQ